ncbi:MAG TPA: class III extradiol ring-cleavage dioxygenase [Burkholderiales bacterium]
MLRLPSIFISHGSPMHALEAGAAGKAWAALGKRLGKPRAVAIASAHWETGLPQLTGNPKPETIHDFSGFPEPLYRIRYAAPGAPEVAARAQALLQEGGFTAAIDARRGLDHGAWSPLLYMYPDADVPVVQLSVQTALGTRHHFSVGKALRSLAAENILVIGSGHLTHNLRDWARGQGRAEPYAREFQSWVKDKIDRKDLDPLLDYRSASPQGIRSHPTEEHFLPLFIALGAAAENYKSERIFDDIEAGVLAMDAYVFH